MDGRYCREGDVKKVVDGEGPMPSEILTLSDTLL